MCFVFLFSDTEENMLPHGYKMGIQWQQMWCSLLLVPTV